MGNVCSCIERNSNSKLKGKYKGEIIGMNKEGRGEFKFLDGNTYDGMWKEDKMNGYGIYTYRNGNKYEGEFKDNKREGHGIFYWRNGSKYDGNFKANKKEGRGRYLNHRGDLYVGEFLNDKREGKFILKLNAGCFYEQLFEKDCLKNSYMFESNWRENELFKFLNTIDSSLIEIFQNNRILDGLTFLRLTNNRLYDIGINNDSFVNQIMKGVENGNNRENLKSCVSRKCCPAGQNVLMITM